MLFKWIRCNVDEEKKAEFSTAQEKWRDLKGYPGFLGQIGGWNVAEPQEACILAFWENLDCYQAFMSNKHDEIFEQSRQKGTYHKISVDIVEVKQPTEFNRMNMTEVLQKSKILYVFDFGKQVLPDLIQKEKNVSAMFMSADEQNRDFLFILCASTEFSQIEWLNTPHTQVQLESAWTVL
jgi:heme-degrading monooxygenase HmoA